MGAHDEAEWFEPATLADWSDWLARHHARSTGVWLVRAKKATGRQAFDYEAAVVEALRYGWIDATQRSIDEERTRLWFSPRRRGSGWAASNKQRIARLEAEGRLEPAGRAAVEAARADGTWTLLEELERLDLPDDLAAALDRHPGARARWEAFPASARRGILGWIRMAKRPETRERRVAETAEKAARGERADMWTPREQR